MAIQYPITITDEHIKAAKILDLTKEDVKIEIDKRVNRYFVSLVRSAKQKLVEDKTVSEIEEDIVK